MFIYYASSQTQTLSAKTQQLPHVCIVKLLVDLSLPPGEYWLVLLPLTAERRGVFEAVLLGYLVHHDTVPDLDPRVGQQGSEPKYDLGGECKEF